MYKKKILIFEDTLSGHRLEYLNHIYEGATEKPDVKFIFAVPSDFIKIKDKLIWNKAENVVFHFFKKDEINKKTSAISNSFYKSRLVKKIVLEYSIDEVFLISLMHFLPFITFLIPSRVKISGIIYLIYLYRWKYSSIVLKIQDYTKYLLLSKRNNFKRIFLLNDKSAPLFLNKKFV